MCPRIMIIIVFYLLSALSLSSSTRTLRRFTLSDLLNKPWSQVSSLPPPPVGALIFIAHGIFFQHFHCSSIFFEHFACSRAFPLINFHARKNPDENALRETRTRNIDLTGRNADHGGRNVLYQSLYFCFSTSECYF